MRYEDSLFLLEVLFRNLFLIKKKLKIRKLLTKAPKHVHSQPGAPEQIKSQEHSSPLLTHPPLIPGRLKIWDAQVEMINLLISWNDDSGSEFFCT